MAAIRHYTSRGGDPHRHLHLQVNARVPAAGKWRGIDSAQMLRMQRAINGIGHRAVARRTRSSGPRSPPTGTPSNPDGEIDQFAAVVPAMSKRSAQVAANIERYERQWRTEHPGQEPGPGLLRAWDERAWADHREAKKNHPTRGPECEAGWITELRDLGVDVDAHLRRRTGPGGRGAGRRGGPGRGRRPGGEGAGRRRPGPVHLERVRHPRRRRGGPHRPERHRPTRGVPGARGGRHRPRPRPVPVGAGPAGAGPHPAPHLPGR